MAGKNIKKNLPSREKRPALADEKFDIKRLQTAYITGIDLSLIDSALEELMPRMTNAFIYPKPQPFGITKTYSFDYDYEYYLKWGYGRNEITKGLIWFAFTFSEHKNNKPNISIIFYNHACDISINSELMTSQRVILKKCQNNAKEFDTLLQDHGGLYLKTYFKIEHQPRFYHWMLDQFEKPSTFSSTSILDYYNDAHSKYNNTRQQLIQFIKKNSNLSQNQFAHMMDKNINLNHAIRLVDPIFESDSFWSYDFKKQLDEIYNKVIKMKKLLYFLLS